MFLCITFEGELLPFILNEAATDEVLHAIEVAKTMCEFDKVHNVVESDRIILHARPKRITPIPKKRLYCYNDEIILQTDVRYPDEAEATRKLLAYERGIPADKICVVEI